MQRPGGGARPATPGPGPPTDNGNVAAGASRPGVAFSPPVLQQIHAEQDEQQEREAHEGRGELAPRRRRCQIEGLDPHAPVGHGRTESVPKIGRWQQCAAAVGQQVQVRLTGKAGGGEALQAGGCSGLHSDQVRIPDLKLQGLRFRQALTHQPVAGEQRVGDRQRPGQRPADREHREQRQARPSGDGHHIPHHRTALPCQADASAIIGQCSAREQPGHRWTAVGNKPP